MKSLTELEHNDLRLKKPVAWMARTVTGDGIDPATAAYPASYADKPSGNWWKFGFPGFYVTDLLQLAEALVSLGYGYTVKAWLDFGKKRQPNEWLTLRDMKVMKAV